MHSRASILVGLLWCLALLSLAVIGILHMVRIDLLVVKNYGDRVQAHYLALAGIEKAKALLYQDTRSRSRSAVNYSGELADAAQQFRAVSLGRGQFQVFRPGRSDEQSGVIYGVSDEEGRLNINTASSGDLSKIVGMTPDIVAAIMDWRDSDNEVTPGGAEADYYASLRPPYQPRNGPFQTIRELLMVRGMTSELLLGPTTEQTAPAASALDEAVDPAASEQLEASDNGWGAMLTVGSYVQNVNAAGEDRVNVQSADETALTSVRGITSDIAKAIVAYRGQNRIENIVDLLNVTAAQNQNQNQNQNQGQNQPQGQRANAPGRGQAPPRGNAPAQPGQSSNPSGQKVISESLLMDIADDVTTQSEQKLNGVININSASLDVLVCLPGMNRDLAQAVISFRQSNGYFPNIAWLMKVQGITQDVFKQLAPRVTARSETYRVLCEGKVTSSGARQRIQAIIHVGLRDVSILSYREDDL